MNQFYVLYVKKAFLGNPSLEDNRSGENKRRTLIWVKMHLINGRAFYRGPNNESGSKLAKLTA
jgi:hypothetical protein